jgi:hypothetical protein
MIECDRNNATMTDDHSIVVVGVGSIVENIHLGWG